MFENRKRGKQARNFTTNVSKILDLKSSSEQIFSRKWPLGAPERNRVFSSRARMGNIRGWGGPLPPSWRKNQLDLQHKILTAMRNLGMAPVLPGFAGFVPDGLKRVYPQAKLSRVSRWGRFNNTFCCGYHLHPNDPLFKVSHLYIFVHILSYKSR